MQSVYCSYKKYSFIDVTLHVHVSCKNIWPLRHWLIDDFLVKKMVVLHCNQAEGTYQNQDLLYNTGIPYQCVPI